MTWSGDYSKCSQCGEVYPYAIDTCPCCQGSCRKDAVTEERNTIIAGNKRLVLLGEQKAVLTLPPKGAVLIKGCAGSGKTLVSVKRAEYLTQNYSDLFQRSKVAIFAYNKELVKEIQNLISDSSILVQNIDAWVYFFLRGRGVRMGMIDRLSRNSVAKLMSQQTVEEFNWFNISDKAVGVCVVADLFRSFIRLGHDTNDLTCPEGLCLLLVLSRIFRCNRQIARDEWKKPDFRKSMDTMFEPYICKINEILPIDGQGGNLVLCDLLISGRQTRMSRSVASAMYEWAKIVAAADGSISAEEGLWLGVLRGYANGEDANTLRSGFAA